MKKESMIASYRDVTSEITRDKDRWAHFLNTVAYMYKYHFADQVMIYGQRQDATMCASFDLWNRLGCWIKSGARGIAIFDANHKSDKIKYVFDVTDTIAKHKAPPKLWKLTRGNAETVSLMLLEEEDIVPSSEKINFRSSLRAAVQSVVEDNYQSYFDQLVQSSQHSALMDLSEQDMQWNFISLLKDSIEYMVQKRCGAANPKIGFRGIEYFNTQRTVNVLGCATSDLARELLIKIERTVKENGRSERNVESDLHAGRGRDSVSRPQDGHESGNADQVRADAKDIPEGPQEQPVHQPTDGRDSGQALQGDSGAGRDAQGRDYGETQETDAAAQDGGLSGDGEVQQPDKRPGRGDRAERDHIQPDELEQTQELPEPVDEISTGSSFSGEITQEDIDHVLLRGSHVEGGRFRIYEQYYRKESNADNIRFLKKEYGIGGGTEYYPDGIRGYADHDGKGIRLQKDNVEEPLQLSWAKVNARLKVLVEDGRYLSPEKVAEIPYYHEWHWAAPNLCTKYRVSGGGIVKVSYTAYTML